ncbi:hypothetical protein [Clostridium sp. YIM B02555]|jgi:hypothetical protein|uniref:hypothetical protein n=1 Tax=Clostridium sp. YIM B02555 TaxID=2911968 RepID=UPI001EED7B96|nr:hypothetical protein [Clostridium sp. YIM B02555]
MKKKIISVLLCAVTVLSFVGCGDTKSNDSSKEAASVSNTNSNDKKDDAKKEESKVLFEDEFAKVTYTGIDRDATIGPQIKVEIENKSDKDITIQLRDVSVDGTMMDPIFSADVLKGKKAKTTIDLMKDKVDKNFKAIEGKFKIMPKDDVVTTLKDEPFKINY